MVSSSTVQAGKFKVGDKINHEMVGAGTVVYGPFLARNGGPGFVYLLEDSEGRHITGSESLLSAVPKFEVGQVVRSRFHNVLMKVAAGPFVWHGTKDPYYVLEHPDGDHTSEDEEDITPVVE